MRTACAIIPVVLIIYLTAMAVYGRDAVPKEVRRKYPEDRYIIRSGTGETSGQAAEAARFEIAKYFESKISGETLVRQWAQSTTSHGKTIEKRLAELSNTIIISASRDIPGIEIAATERDRKSKTYEAWAVLEKNMYASILKERIEKIDRNVDARLNRPLDSDITHVRVLSGVISDLVLREQSTQDFFLLDTDSTVTSRDRLLYAVMTSLDSLIAEAFDVGIVFTGDVKDNVSVGVVKGIVDAGIRIKKFPDMSTAADDGSDLVMSVEHEVSPKTTSFRERVFHNVDWVLSVKAEDPSTGEIIDAFVQNDKVAGAQNESQAEDRMVKKILESQVPLITSWVYKVIFKPE